ncbi:MAG: hypothetical protein C0465_08175 [Ralstonia sp.]|nr:hypothetical protein [Ralstonia sp.]POH87530.1 hypothetical protein CJ026_011855 [Ralstonia pickettii]MBA4230582.1 hypothetical protein [Ralstonia sp.]MBA4237165.1 hypothetical protein [Ralstonia sp.]MBA4281859.1 hypothetical protein [Ralstonia sp.]
MQRINDAATGRKAWLTLGSHSTGSPYDHQRRATPPGGCDSSLFRTLPGTTHFSLSCQRKEAKERRARDGDFPLNLCDRAGKEANSLRSDRPPSFSARSQKFKAPSRAQRQKRERPTHRTVGLFVWAGAPRVWVCPLTFLP